MLDFPLSFAIRRWFDPESLVGQFVEKVAKIRHAVREKWHYIANYDAYLRSQVYQKKRHSLEQKNDRHY